MDVPDENPKACAWWQPHKWSAWSVPSPGTKTGLISKQQFDVEVQTRDCLRCREREMRECR